MKNALHEDGTDLPKWNDGGGGGRGDDCHASLLSAHCLYLTNDPGCHTRAPA